MFGLCILLLCLSLISGPTTSLALRGCLRSITFTSTLFWWSLMISSSMALAWMLRTVRELSTWSPHSLKIPFLNLSMYSLLVSVSGCCACNMWSGLKCLRTATSRFFCRNCTYPLRWLEMSSLYHSARMMYRISSVFGL